MNIAALATDYNRDGYVSGVPILSMEEARQHRAALEQAENQLDTNLHYQSKMHTIHTSPLALATRPDVLDLVEAMIGPDILLYNSTYIIKEPHSPSHVSWHQDLTYWGLSHDDQVSMWLALSVADEVSGCMRMIPTSHTQGRFDHMVLCPLNPGEASFHHGWTLHASMPNHSDDRRIGLNVQYLAAHVRQTKHDLDTAMLVRGTDKYNHFERDIPASTDLAPDALHRQKMLDDRYKMIAGNS